MNGLIGEPENKQEQAMANPTGKGGFQKGQSGNPGGRPKVMADVQELAREHTPAAIYTLVSIMNDEKAHHSARVAASNAILDRGYGKAPASVKMELKGQSAAEQWISILKDIGEIRAKEAAAKAALSTDRTATQTTEGTNTVQ